MSCDPATSPPPGAKAPRAPPRRAARSVERARIESALEAEARHTARARSNSASCCRTPACGGGDRHTPLWGSWLPLRGRGCALPDRPGRDAHDLPPPRALRHVIRGPPDRPGGRPPRSCHMVQISHVWPHHRPTSWPMGAGTPGGDTCVIWLAASENATPHLVIAMAATRNPRENGRVAEARPPTSFRKACVHVCVCVSPNIASSGSDSAEMPPHRPSCQVASGAGGQPPKHACRAPSLTSLRMPIQPRMPTLMLAYRGELTSRGRDLQSLRPELQRGHAGSPGSGRLAERPETWRPWGARQPAWAKRDLQAVDHRQRAPPPLALPKAASAAGP